MDESFEAQAVATRFGTEHTEVRLPDNEVVAQVPLAVASMDLPSIDGVNTFIVSHAVRSMESRLCSPDSAETNCLADIAVFVFFLWPRSGLLGWRTHTAPICGIVFRRRTGI